MEHEQNAWANFKLSEAYVHALKPQTPNHILHSLVQLRTVSVIM